VELQVDWVNGDLSLPADEVTEHLATLFTAAGYWAIADDAAYDVRGDWR
jgi:hypothetical protein